MNRKHLTNIQITLALIGFILILLTYFYYPYTKKNQMAEIETNQDDLKVDTSDEKTTFFNNVEYKALMDFNKPFVLSAEKAHIKKNVFNLNNCPPDCLDESDIIFMTNMEMKLYLQDGRIVIIRSKKGTYNRVSHNTFFTEDVFASDGETRILSQNLNLLATKSLVEIYENVVLSYPTGSLKADKLEYDFESKNFNVSMFDDRKIKLKVIK
tara:strand:- start:172 stop:804 length:633 start_codon:yes stop_codon:yes gene_type:complete